MKKGILICPVCESRKNIILLWKNVVSWDISGLSNYYKCLNCRLIFLYPRPSSTTLSKHYRSLSYWGVDRLKHNSSYWHEKAEKDYGYIFKIIKTKNIGSVLDVGSGTGLFLYKLKSEGWNVLGTEISKAARIFSKKYLGIDSVESIKIFQNKIRLRFDLIVMNNVIEHLSDPKIELNDIRNVMNTSGTLLIVTPNTESIGFKLFGQKWYHLDPGRHTDLYNSKNISDLLVSSGFKINWVKHGYFVHNYAGIFESIRHYYKNNNMITHEIGRNGEMLNTNNRASIVKKIMIIISKLISYIIVSLEPAFKRGEVILLSANIN